MEECGDDQITIEAMKNSEVYVCGYEHHEFRSQVQKHNFTTKKEKLRLSSGTNLIIAHKVMLVNEKVEFTGNWAPWTIFVR